MRAIYASLVPSWRRAGCDLPAFEEFWQQEYAQLAEPAQDMVLFEEFRRDPERARLHTPSGRIQIHSGAIAAFGYDDCPPQPTWLEPAEWLGSVRARQWPLHLVSSQPADKLHSQLDAGECSQAQKLQGRQRARLNPADAKARGIDDGALVRIFNARGSCLAGATLDDQVMSGVLVLSTGAWFDPQDAALERHGNPNVLTLDIGTSRLTQGTSAMTALVEVAPWRGPAPPVQAFELPELVAG